MLEPAGFLPLAAVVGVVEDFAVVAVVEDFAVVDVVALRVVEVEDGPVVDVEALADDGPVVVVEDADAAWAWVIWMLRWPSLESELPSLATKLKASTSTPAGAW